MKEDTHFKQIDWYIIFHQASLNMSDRLLRIVLNGGKKKKKSLWINE